MKSEDIKELAAALVQAQGEFPIIPKQNTGTVKGTSKTGNAYEYNYKYADLATVVEAAKPIAAKHGLAVSQFITNDGSGGSLLKTYLLHQSGQYIAEEMPLYLPKEDPQGQGSAVTYARRYSYASVLGLVADEDDDGNKASNKPVESYSKPQKPELINPTKLTQLKQLMLDAGLVGEMAIKFSKEKINKNAPQSNDDVDRLIAAIKDEPF